METNSEITLKFTKFFKTKSPLTSFNDENLFNDIGVEIYLPPVSYGFILVLLNIYKNHKFKVNFKSNKIGNEIEKFIIYKDSFFKTKLFEYDGENYIIYDNIQIPTGIGLLIPKGYHIDLRSKSSNFTNYFTSVTGLIDETYTYGCGIQIIKLSKDKLILKPEIKISQIVLIKSNPIGKMEEVDLDVWNNMQEVNQKRILRTGGFGSTGKF